MITESIRDELLSKEEEPDMFGIMTVSTANKTIEAARLLPDPKTWFHGMIVAGENTVLFASSNVGKSILAVQIAEEIAQKEWVLYIDLELSDKQFQMRYCEGEVVHHFPEKLLRAMIRPEDLMTDNLEDAILSSIQCAAEKGVAVIIIDNISFACINAEKSEYAGEFMKRLIALKGSYHLTIIVIAHTPKRSRSETIEQDDLAGSSKLINHFDAGIAMARSAKAADLRYIKQVKVRTGEFNFDSDNVMVCELTKDDGWLHFNIVGYESEYAHLKSIDSAKSRESRICEVADLLNEGKSVREIAKVLNLSHGTAQRLCEKARHRIKSESVPDVPTVPTGTDGTPGTDPELFEK